jgi:hypothetical protein
MGRISFGILLTASLLLVSCSKKEPEVQKAPEIKIPRTEVEWESVTHDFGKQRGDKVLSHKFKFTNTGKNFLVIYEVKPSCSCTVGNYTYVPVPPGGSGYVELSFDPTGKSGIAANSAGVVMNTEPTVHRLKFHADLNK